MKTSIISLLLFLTYCVCSGQTNAIQELKKITNTLNSKATDQDTTKPKNLNQGAPSNIAVSDEGAPADKSKTENKKLVENPLEIFQKDVIKGSAPKNSTVPTTNLAVSDEGSAADKPKKKTARETAGVDTTSPPKQTISTTSGPK